MKFFFTISIVIMNLGFSASAHEVNFSGEIGAALGLNKVNEIDGWDTYTSSGLFPYQEFDGRIVQDLNNSLKVAFDVHYRQEGYHRDDTTKEEESDTFGKDEAPDVVGTIGLHGYYNLPNSLVGGFIGYTDTRPQDNDKEDAYDALILGISGQNFFADNVLIFGQVSASNKVRDGENDKGAQGQYTYDEGIDEGYGLGAGVQLFMSDMQALTLDLEIMSVSNYVDSNDPGRGYGYIATYEKMIEGLFAPIVLSSQLGYAHISGTDEGDAVDELTANFGIRILFGEATDLRSRAETGANLDTPYLPGRMAGWTEWID